MPANTQIEDWGNEPTVILPAYRCMTMGGPCGILIHLTPAGTHVVDMDCDGTCLVCMGPLDGPSQPTA